MTCCSSTKTRRWDANRSLRWNQDSQREEDQHRMQDMVVYLTKLRLQSDKSEKAKQREVRIANHDSKSSRCIYSMFVVCWWNIFAT